MRKLSSPLTKEDLAKWFHISLANAAKKLGVCETTLQKCARSHGIKRWPSRKVTASMRNGRGPRGNLTTMEINWEIVFGTPYKAPATTKPAKRKVMPLSMVSSNETGDALSNVESVASSLLSNGADHFGGDDSPMSCNSESCSITAHQGRIPAPFNAPVLPGFDNSTALCGDIAPLDFLDDILDDPKLGNGPEVQLFDVADPQATFVMPTPVVPAQLPVMPSINGINWSEFKPSQSPMPVVQSQPSEQYRTELVSSFLRRRNNSLDASVQQLLREIHTAYTNSVNELLQKVSTLQVPVQVPATEPVA